VLLAAFAAACGSAAAAGPGSSPALGLTVYAHPVAAPDVITGRTLGGSRVSVARWRGRVVVVNFWQPDCAPCTAEAPLLNRLARSYPKSRVSFLGIEETSTLALGRRYEKAEHVPYASIADPSGLYLAHWGRLVDAGGTPDTVVLNASGRVVASVVGQVHAGTLTRVINGLLRA
jgi:thiol-disulfide isomerase/thioredoxin